MIHNLLSKVSICLLFLIVSCAKPMLSNLEKGAYLYTDVKTDILNVAVSLLPLPKTITVPEKPKSFFDMRDSLPHIFLRIMSAKTSTPQELIDLLSKPLSAVAAPHSDKKESDFTEYKIRLSFSNLKKYYNDERFMHPNTRLEFLTTTLEIPVGSAISFYNIDKLENEFDEIDFGNLSRDQTVSLNAKLAVNGALGGSSSSTDSEKYIDASSKNGGNKRSVFDEDGNEVGSMNRNGTFSSTRETNQGNSSSADAKVGANAEVGYLNSESIKEAIAVKLKRLRTGFNFSERSLTVAQRGRPLGDISDNIYINAVLKVSTPANVLSLNVYNFDKLFDANSSPIKADKLMFASRNVNFTPCDKATDIDLKSSYEGAVRAVDNQPGSSGENALEYDDKVTFFKIAKTYGSDLKIKASLYCKEAYKVVATSGGDSFVLKIAAPLEEELDIFIDDQPSLLLHWLNETISNPSADNLATKKFKMYFENIRTHGKIFIVKDAFTNTEINSIKALNGIALEKRGM